MLPWQPLYPNNACEYNLQVSVFTADPYCEGEWPLKQSLCLVQGMNTAGPPGQLSHDRVPTAHTNNHTPWALTRGSHHNAACTTSRDRDQGQIKGSRLLSRHDQRIKTDFSWYNQRSKPSFRITYSLFFAGIWLLQLTPNTLKSNELRCLQ